MILNLLRLSLFSLLFAPILFSSSSYGDDPWVLLEEGEKKKYQRFYNKTSIQKIKDNVMEVYDVTAKPDGNTFRQLRINCKTGEYAIGKSELFTRGAESPYQTLDLSKNGWMWFKPGNAAEKQLIHIVCKKEK
jgi:hypothetical protein